MLDPGTATTAAGVELDSLAHAGVAAIVVGVGLIAAFAAAVRLFAISADRRAEAQITTANLAFASGLIAVTVVVGGVVAALIVVSS